ncbi:hypothetical protein HYC85_018172 [Camellia sinensis]|uniref:pyruvate dehydrogenase (acetyl-transferring) n=1 Tax=Camellia sinensis TaxID=4442 RepID=A0A7J7GV71_CAMSI|nr:hypothetical protein HYC85_018172 [Camellia sinensis]
MDLVVTIHLDGSLSADMACVSPVMCPNSIGPPCPDGLQLSWALPTGLCYGSQAMGLGLFAVGRMNFYFLKPFDEGLEEEMERDPRVCVMGFSDTPIAENSFTGMAIGAAMTGLRPIVEGMNMGFLLLAFNQISNNCGMLHYTSGGQFTIPVVIRGPGGVGRQLGAEHSQRLESYFQSIPGIQMVACSTPYNAKGLMKAAIRSENPVILFEHVLLYNLKERIPDEEYVLNLEEAEMVRPGEHVTILTYSRMRYHVMQAAKTLVNKGYDPEVIDIRSLKPFDLHTIGNSVKKTHRDVPTPYAGTLEEWTVVQPAQIVTAVEQLCRRGGGGGGVIAVMVVEAIMVGVVTVVVVVEEVVAAVNGGIVLELLSVSLPVRSSNALVTQAVFEISQYLHRLVKLLGMRDLRSSEWRRATVYTVFGLSSELKLGERSVAFLLSVWEIRALEKVLPFVKWHIWCVWFKTNTEPSAKAIGTGLEG